MVTRQSNTSWSPWQYYNGFKYRVRWDGIGYWYWEVVDSAGGSVPGGSGSVAGDRLDFQVAISSAIDFIDNHDDDEYFEDTEIGGDWKSFLSDRCYNLETRNVTLDAGIGLNRYIWRVTNINGEVIYTQTFPQEYGAAISDAKGYLSSLPDQEGCGDNGGGNGGGGVELNGDSDVLRIAGIFVVGVAKGTLIAMIPIVAMSAAVGFMRRGSRYGAEVGS